MNLCKPQAIHLPHFITVNQTGNVKLIKRGKMKNQKDNISTHKRAQFVYLWIQLSKRAYTSCSKTFIKKNILCHTKDYKNAETVTTEIQRVN